MHQLVFLILSLFLPDATFSAPAGSCNRQCSSTTVPYPPDPNTNTNVRAWAHGFAQQEEKTKGRAYLVMLVAGEGAEDGDLGTWRRAAANRRRPPQRQTAHATGTGVCRERARRRPPGN